MTTILDRAFAELEAAVTTDEQRVALFVLSGEITRLRTAVNTVSPQIGSERVVFRVGTVRLEWRGHTLMAGPIPLGFVFQYRDGWRYALSGSEPSRFCETEAEARAALEAAAMKALFGEEG